MEVRRQEECTWWPVAQADDLPTDGTGITVLVEGRHVALFSVEGELKAVDDACPHQGASLGMGVVVEGEIACSWHGWHFDLETGENTDGLASCIAVHPVRVSAGGTVEVALPPESV